MKGKRIARTVTPDRGLCRVYGPAGQFLGEAVQCGAFAWEWTANGKTGQSWRLGAAKKAISRAYA
jgi:hypothetical protein